MKDRGELNIHAESLESCMNDLAGGVVICLRYGRVRSVDRRYLY